MSSLSNASLPGSLLCCFISEVISVIEFALDMLPVLFLLLLPLLVLAAVVALLIWRIVMTCISRRASS